MAKESNAPTIGNEAVLQATGKGWDEWFRILDEQGAASLDHPEIVALLTKFEGVSGWWQQSITVAYEKARGLRKTHERPDGFSVSASKTVNASAAKVFAVWGDDALRAQWLAEPIAIRKATPSKSLRITWADDSHVDVYLTAKGEAKTQLSLQHRKLESEESVAPIKAFWQEALARMKQAAEA